jgi:hypothetical protein
MRVFLRKKIDIVGPDALVYRDGPEVSRSNRAKKAGIQPFTRGGELIWSLELTPSP